MRICFFTKAWYIPLEFMDLIVDPLAEQLVGAHGDRIISRVM